MKTLLGLLDLGQSGSSYEILDFRMYLGTRLWPDTDTGTVAVRIATSVRLRSQSIWADHYSTTEQFSSAIEI